MAVDPQIIIAVIGTLGTLGGAAIGAWIAGSSSKATALRIALVERDKHKHDRLWDARREAYTVIVAAMSALEKTASRMDDRMNGHEADAEGYYQSQTYNEDAEELWSEFRAVKAAYEGNILVLSEGFKAAYAEWQKDFFYEEEGIPPQQADAHYNAMRQHIPLFVELAQAEIWPV